MFPYPPLFEYAPGNLQNLPSRAPLFEDSPGNLQILPSKAPFFEDAPGNLPSGLHFLGDVPWEFADVALQGSTF